MGREDEKKERKKQNKGEGGRGMKHRRVKKRHCKGDERRIRESLRSSRGEGGGGEGGRTTCLNPCDRVSESRYFVRSSKSPCDLGSSALASLSEEQNRKREGTLIVLCGRECACDYL